MSEAAIEVTEQLYGGKFDYGCVRACKKKHDTLLIISNSSVPDIVFNFRSHP